VQEAYKLGGRRSARLVGVAWTTLCYKSCKKSQDALVRRLRELAATHVRFGYRRLTVLLRREGWKVNAKRVYRLYDEENLKVRSVERKKIARRQRVPQARACGPNQCWSADFVSDKLSDGRSIRILTVIDQFTRECVCLQADRSMNGRKVVAALMKAIAERGASPHSLTLDNGSEFAGRAMEAWAIETGVQLCFIRPGRPVENGLNVEWFSSLDQMRQKLAEWKEHYNHRRPHSALDDRAPAAFASLHQHGRGERFALSHPPKTNSEPRQGFAAPADAALDPARRLSEDILDQGEALFRIARSQSPLLSLWSDFQARKSGPKGP
jgi:putative transposase